MCSSETKTPVKPSTTPSCSESTENASKATCPLEVSVSITLSAAVACPGHPFEMNASGSPSGGTYSWTVSGGKAELIDGTGNAKSTGLSVFFRSFQPDDKNGNIPERSVSVVVTYNHPNGSATDTKIVKIHKIDFDVTHTLINTGLTQVNEGASSVTLGGAPGTNTMSTRPSIEIQLDASCPRKNDCAKNYQVGWLQAVTANERKSVYTHTLIEVTINLPIRDGDAVTPVPWYDAKHKFTGDKDKQNAFHFDSPGNGASWIDPRPGSPAPPPNKNKKLQNIFFSNSFHAWLVVQNIEWKGHDMENSFVYLRNFAWSVKLDVIVDVSKSVGSRCTPVSKPPTIGALGIGKGGVSPVLSEPFPNRDHKVNVTPIK